MWDLSGPADCVSCIGRQILYHWATRGAWVPFSCFNIYLFIWLHGGPNCGTGSFIWHAGTFFKSCDIRNLLARACGIISCSMQNPIAGTYGIQFPNQGWNLTPPTHTHTWGVWSPATGPPGKSQDSVFLFWPFSVAEAVAVNRLGKTLLFSC